MSEKWGIYFRSIKEILLLFEAMAELKVNLRKSLIIGISVPQYWIIDAIFVLKFKIDFLPLNYLGLPIGTKSSRKDTWNRVIKPIKLRLNKWKTNIFSLVAEL